MAYVSLAEVKQWFEGTKLDDDFTVDSELEDTAVALVFGRLQDAYDTVTWYNATATPPLVRKIIAMYIAAWFYQRTYSDDNDLSNYGQRLETAAARWLEGVVGGVYDLGASFTKITDGVYMTADDFWPNDSTEEGPYFTMGQCF